MTDALNITTEGQERFPSIKDIRIALQPEKQKGSSNRFTDGMVIAIAILFAFYIVIGVFFVYFARHKSFLAPGLYFAFLLDELFLVSTLLINFSVQIFLAIKEARAGGRKQDRYKQKLEREDLLVVSLKKFPMEVLKERQKRFDLESDIYGYSTDNLPNVVTASATLLAVLLTAIFTVWFTTSVQQQPVKLNLASFLQPMLALTIGIAFILTFTMYLGKRNADNRELYSRAAWACKKARTSSRKDLGNIPHPKLPQ